LPGRDEFDSAAQSSLKANVAAMFNVQEADVSFLGVSGVETPSGPSGGSAGRSSRRGSSCVNALKD
jgi:hypothetical protein